VAEPRSVSACENFRMYSAAGFIAVTFLMASTIFFVKSAYALSVNYSYLGSKFTEIEGEPDIFSSDDRVTARFSIDCAIAHVAGTCINLPFND